MNITHMRKIRIFFHIQLIGPVAWVLILEFVVDRPLATVVILTCSSCLVLAGSRSTKAAFHKLTSQVHIGSISSSSPHTTTPHTSSTEVSY